jgi:hypothetical protein
MGEILQQIGGIHIPAHYPLKSLGLAENARKPAGRLARLDFVGNTPSF